MSTSLANRKNGIDPQFVNLMNENGNIMSQGFAERLIDHRSIGFRAQAVTKFEEPAA